MLIDWFTVCAQAINFLILVWLMKRFLYTPILNAIDVRENGIAKELSDADTKKAEAKKEGDDFAQKNKDFEQNHAALLKKATDDVAGERQRLLAAAGQEVDQLRAKRMEALQNDARNLSQSISARTALEVFAIARRTLSDLATTSLEERIGEVFTRRLRDLEGQAKAKLGQALKNGSEPALIQSTFDIGAEQRAAIQNAINETFSAAIPLRFETAPNLVSGIELTKSGQKLGWSIDDYLTSMEKGVAEALNNQGPVQPAIHSGTVVPAVSNGKNNGNSG